MVCFKVTDGCSTRKFKVQPGDVSYDQLKERLAGLFPDSLQAGRIGDLCLHYRDTDGDIITISTDTEFQEVLSELPQDSVWKLHIRDLMAKQQRQQEERRRQDNGISRSGDADVSSCFYFQPSSTPSLRVRTKFNPYSKARRQLCSPWLSPSSLSFSFSSVDPWLQDHQPAWSALDREFERMVEEHTQLLDALHNTTTTKDGEDGAQGEAATNSQSQSDSKDTEAKPKPTTITATTNSCVPGLQIKNFGSWEPQELECPFGTRRVIGPVGYYMSWSSGPSKGSSGGNKEEEGSGTKETAASKEQEPKQAAEGKDITS